MHTFAARHGTARRGEAWRGVAGRGKATTRVAGGFNSDTPSDRVVRHPLTVLPDDHAPNFLRFDATQQFLASLDQSGFLAGMLRLDIIDAGLNPKWKMRCHLIK